MDNNKQTLSTDLFRENPVYAGTRLTTYQSVHGSYKELNTVFHIKIANIQVSRNHI